MLPQPRKYRKTPLASPVSDAIKEILIVADQVDFTWLPGGLEALNYRSQFHFAFCRTLRPSSKLRGVVAIPQDASPTARTGVTVTGSDDRNGYGLHVYSLRCQCRGSIAYGWVQHGVRLSYVCFAPGSLKLGRGATW